MILWLGNRSSETPRAPSRRRRVARWAPWATAGLGSLALLVGVLSDEGGLPALTRLRANVKQLEQRNADLALENATLRARVRSIEHDPDALELEARRGPHYLRNSEWIVTWPEPAPSSSVGPHADPRAAD